MGCSSHIKTSKYFSAMLSLSLVTSSDVAAYVLGGQDNLLNAPQVPTPLLLTAPFQGRDCYCPHSTEAERQRHEAPCPESQSQHVAGP